TSTAIAASAFVPHGLSGGFGNAHAGASGQTSSTSASGTAILKRAIPSTGEQLPVIGAGTSGSYDAVVGSPEYERLIKTIKVFFDGGGSVFDTAPNYGNADTALGQLLVDGNWRSRTFLATKIAADTRADGEAQWATSLKRLHSDKVELLQVHNMRAW